MTTIHHQEQHFNKVYQFFSENLYTILKNHTFDILKNFELCVHQQNLKYKDLDTSTIKCLCKVYTHLTFRQQDDFKDIQLLSLLAIPKDIPKNKVEEYKSKLKDFESQLNVAVTSTPPRTVLLHHFFYDPYNRRFQFIVFNSHKAPDDDDDHGPNAGTFQIDCSYVFRRCHYNVMQLNKIIQYLISYYARRIQRLYRRYMKSKKI